MKAMILAAGLGTRLRPLTNERPKALVELNGRTLLEITITRLAKFGVTDFIVNVHHHAQMVADYLQSKNNFGYRIELSREDDQLLDTGGALKKAAWFFLENVSTLEQAPPHKPSTPTRHSPLATRHFPSEPFFLHNVDVISNIDLNAMLQFHKKHDALATLAVQSRDSSRQLLFNNNLQLSGRRINTHDEIVNPSPQIPVILSEAKNPAPISSPPATNELADSSVHSLSERSEESAFSSDSPLATRHSPLPQSKESSPLLPLAFSGIHVISPRLLPQLTESTPVFSIIDSYLRLSSQGEKILAFRHDSSYWRDLGKPADLTQAAHDLQQ
ncbi:MAG: sugar phosphate nucleotidyltransferase [Candidatus Acidiferrum sp.]